MGCHISEGNLKLGKTPNVNLPPEMTCKNMPCYKEGCYALKAWRIYPVVRKSWTENYDLYKKNPTQYFQEIADFINNQEFLHYFRWNASGEIPDQKYLDGMIKIAIQFPETKFLVFTKKYGLDFSKKPDNFSVIFSSWPGLKIPKKIRENNSIAWMEDGTQSERIENESFHVRKECSGHCGKECRICWNMPKEKLDIIFHKH